MNAFYVAHLPESVSLESALAQFRALGEVESADPIAVLPVSAVPNDSLWSLSSWFYQPSRHDIHVTEAWDLTTGDSSIVIAILDTGVLPYHPDLGGVVAGAPGQIWTNGIEAAGLQGVDDDGNGYVDDIHGWDFVNRASASGISAGEDWRDEDGDPNDYAGHGTAVAGLAGALSDNGTGITGTAWRVRLMPLRIGWSAIASPLGLVDMSYVAQALRYATRMGASVANCSFATINQAGLFEAASAAIGAGVTLVAAAGNNGQLHELAAREDVIAVASSDFQDHISAFSNLGDYVDLCAPGDEMISTFVSMPRPPGGDSVAVRQPGYVTGLDGTSFAAPLVSGAVALMQALRRAQDLPPLAPGDVLLRLRQTTDDISALNPTVSGYGTGRLNVYRLLTGDVTTATAISLVEASAEPGVARLAWWVCCHANMTATLLRRPERGAWVALAILIQDAEGLLHFEDRDVAAGETYAYRLRLEDPAGGWSTAEEWLRIPAGHGLALRGARPNPAQSELSVAFTLPDGHPATLELFDLAGRRIVRREIGGLGPGEHRVRLADPSRLAPGLYEIRLIRAERVLTARACVIR